MSRKEKFLRQCCSCRGFFDKSELIRITKDNTDGVLKLNNDCKIFGRSVYICNNLACISDAVKKKKIEKSLNASLTECLKDMLHNCT